MGPIIFMVFAMEKKPKGLDLDKEVDSLVRYRSELAPNDRAVFDKLLSHAKNHVSACAKSERSLFESILLAIVLEQQKMIEEIAGRSVKPGPGARFCPQDLELAMPARNPIKHPLPWAASC